MQLKQKKRKLRGSCLLALSFCICFVCSAGKEASLENLRDNMVKKQIESRGVTDKRVLAAMRSVERHRFVPDQQIGAAYEDHPLPIGYGQTISQPYIVALMSELCHLGGNEKVLEIGTGSGYQAAVLSLLAKEVYTIEIVDPLGKASALRLKNLGYSNVSVRVGDGYGGWPEKAPFDVIMLTASPPKIPQSLIDQLADGGLLVAPEGDFNQELVVIEKRGGSIIRRTVTYVRFVPMVRGEKER
ncbi:MAG: protein-L-isoaspartate(D-aspartate) O-methyltransferase [Spirochaetales bacterium]|nr:MAG: protein-L-isoaspartate(D-aspartate) O-methyltransferase [Spirochaetales bacterium]